VRLAQQVAALHLVLQGPLDDRRDLSPVLVAAVAFGMVLQATIAELGARQAPCS
jgi:hypothetical protein